MGRSSFVGYVTLFLLLAAAFIVMRQSGAGAGMLSAFGVEPDSAATGQSTDLDPRVQPFRSPSTRASTDQADRMIQDIEAMGEAYP